MKFDGFKIFAKNKYEMEILIITFWSRYWDGVMDRKC